MTPATTRSESGPSFTGTDARDIDRLVTVGLELVHLTLTEQYRPKDCFKTMEVSVVPSSLLFVLHRWWRSRMFKGLCNMRSEEAPSGTAVLDRSLSRVQL
jgi:hypothetical protein